MDNFLNVEMYKRDFNVMKHYTNQNAILLSKSAGISYEEALKFVQDELKGKHGRVYKDATIEYLQKQDNGDRKMVQTDLTAFMSLVEKNNWVLSPSFTVYEDPKKLLSPYTPYMIGNMNRRKLHKKKGQQAEAEKRLVEANFENTLQVAMKTDNNAVSGLQAVASTGLVNRTAHSTLTSICRITTAFGSGHCERFIAGKRLYLTIDAALANIASVIEGTDLEKFDNVIKKYNLAYPTILQTVNLIKRSMEYYPTHTQQWNLVYNVVNNMTDVERAAFCYTGDFYHLRLFNDSFVRTILDKLMTKGSECDKGDMTYIHKAHEDVLIHAKQICTDETKGIGSDLSKLSEKDLGTLYKTVTNIEAAMSEYAELFHMLFINKNPPSYVSHFPDSVRECVLGGDTDSTFYTTQDWIQWYNGSLKYDQEFINVCSSIVFLTSITLKHILAIFSTQLGAEEKERHRIDMKNEYRFDVFVTTNLGKHYYALKTCQEGNVFDKPKYEFKGANIISNSAPKRVVSTVKSIMEKIMHDTLEKGVIDCEEIIRIVADVELDIIASINKGDIEFLRTGKIKPAASYKNGADTAAYKQHELWAQVFESKYGSSGPLPYVIAKISTSTEKTHQMKEWIDSIKDKDLAKSFSEYLERENKKSMSTFTMPLSVLMNKGIPEEIQQAIDYRKIVYSACKSMYIVLESIGVYLNNEKTMTLAMEWCGHKLPGVTTTEG